MIGSDQIEIPVSKFKLFLMLSGSIAFVAAGVWFVTHANEIDAGTIHLGTPIVFIIGCVSILFFGLCAVFIFKKIIGNNAGLIINNDGITDNSSGISAGLILWKDINGIKKITISNQDMLMVTVNNPEDYISRQSSFIKRKAMEFNLNNYGSPISISANGLQCNFDYLYKTLVDKFNSNKH